MEKTKDLKDGVDMDVNDHLSISFIPDDSSLSSYNTLRLNFKEIGDENISILLTPCEALDIISALGVAVQFYLHNQDQYKNDVVKYLIDNKKMRRNNLLKIDIDKLKRINENKKIESYDDIYDVVTLLSGGNKDIMIIVTEILDNILEIKPEIYSPESYFLSFFDLYGIYEGDIKFLYEEICEKNPKYVIVLFIAMGLDIMSIKFILDGIANKTKLSIDFLQLISSIEEKIPLFTI